MKCFKINLKPIPINANGALSDYLVTKCFFCQKKFKIDSNCFQNLHKLSGGKEIFCGFCIRNGFNNRNNKDVIILTFKNIFNHYYSQNHIALKKMWISEIRDLVENHKNIGLLNPTFYYDEDSMNWFINFLKVGDTRKKINIEEIKKTISLIIESLMFKKMNPEIKEEYVKQKYLDAIDLFYKKRYRPKNKKVLSPKICDSKDSVIF